MKPTRVAPLLVLAAVGGAAGWLVELMLVGSGQPSLVSRLPLTLGVALALIGALIVFAALPVFRVVRRVAGARVDPFYATRIVLLAKASSLTGAIVLGAAVSIFAFLLTRPVTASAGPVTMAIVTLVGAVLLLVGGLVAEKMCTLPPEDEGRPPGLTDQATL